jgi:macrolide transport system ATP-binding/permease protein
MGLLDRLNTEGRTILAVTHSREVAAHAGRILHMQDGQILRRTAEHRPGNGPSGGRTDVTT